MSGPSELTPDVVESSGTPLGSSLFSDHTELSTEQVEIGIFQRDNQTIFALLTVAVSTRICSIQCKTHQQGILIAQEEVISVYGDQQGSPIGEGIDLPAGDYCLGLIFNSKEEADSVLSICFDAQSYPLSNFYLSQIMFGMYRSMGFEPSHVLKYPNRSLSAGTPFYRKTRADIEKARDQIKGELKLIHEQPPSWVQQTPQWVQQTPQWVNQTPSWMNQTPQWVNQTPSWIQQQPSWVNQTPQWMQQTPSWMNQTPSWANQWMSEPPPWFGKFTEMFSDLSRSVQTLQNSFDELKTSFSSSNEKVSELSTLTQSCLDSTLTLTTNSDKVMQKVDLLCQKVESPLQQPSEVQEEPSPVLPDEKEEKKEDRLVQLQIKLDEVKLTLDKLTQDEPTLNLQSSIDKSSSTLQHITELVERSNGMLDRLVQTQSTPVNLEELHLTIKKTLQELLASSLSPAHSEKEGLDILTVKLQKSLEDLNQAVIQRLTQMQSEFSRVLEHQNDQNKDVFGKIHLTVEALGSLKTQLEKSAESQQKVVPIEDIERLIVERKTFYEQLQRAEDYIDHVQDTRRSPPDRRTSRDRGRRLHGH